MSESNSQLSILRRLITETLLWLIAPTTFLWFYVEKFSAPKSAVLPHLSLIALLVVLLWVVRLVCIRWLPRTLGRWLAATITASFAMTLILYYGIVLIGLDSWGRVVSVDLITTYSAQFLSLLNTLGIPATFVIVGLFSLFLFVVFVFYHYLTRFDWISILSPKLSGKLVATILLGILGAITLRLIHFYDFPWTKDGEPIGLTLIPELGVFSFQSNPRSVFENAKHSSLDELARSNYAPKQVVSRRNVILIVVDALRADHLSNNGYTRTTTPGLLGMTEPRQARNFGSLHASCSETACGMQSLLTSKYVHQFSNQPFSLQEVLKRYGYRIHMNLGGDHINFYGLRDVYGQVDTYFDGSMAKSRYMNDDMVVIDHLSAFQDWSGEPVMMQFHLMSSHPLGTRHPEHGKFLPAENYSIARTQLKFSGELQHYVNYYDNGVVQADALIGQILSILETKGYLKDSLVIITADHGELLGEHELLSHAKSVFEPVLRIPLILLSYGYEPKAVSEFAAGAGQVDIAPTILAELGMPIPQNWAGQPLQQPGKRRFSHFQQGNEIGIIDVQNPSQIWKYWVNIKTGQAYAFDLSNDPGESKNVVDIVDSELKATWQDNLPNSPSLPTLSTATNAVTSQ